MNTHTNDIKAFLESYKKYILKYEKEIFLNQKRSYDNFFEGLEVPLNKHKEFIKSEAPGFNVFEIIKLNNFTRLEVVMHTPILANFLNPKGTHGQNELFYEKLLKQIDLAGINSKQFLPTDYSMFFVEMEKHTSDGNIDILITNDNIENKFAICIENKIDAQDQKNQLKRYYEYLINSPYKENFLLIYLTKTGYNATEYSIDKKSRLELKEDKKLINLSHRTSIYEMLIDAKEKVNAESVKAIINQYSQIIKNL